MRRFSLLCALALLSTTGCQLADMGRDMTRHTVRMFRPKPADYRDATEESGDDWAHVGQEARGDRPVEKDPDSWWQKYIMSEKARNIESNLGIAKP